MRKIFTPFIIIAALFAAMIVIGCSTEATSSIAVTSTPPLTATISAPSLTTILPSGEEPVEVISVVGPIPPYNPGGPVVEITLKNTADEPVVSLSTTLEAGRVFDFAFDVTLSSPLSPGKTISIKRTLIGGGFATDSIRYPLAINGTLQSLAGFFYTKQVLIESPE